MSSPSQLPPHVQIYTWPTCTIRELSHLLVTALPKLLPEPAVGTRLAYRLIFADTRDAGRPGGPGAFVSKELGSIVLGVDGQGVLPSGNSNGSGDESANIVTGGPLAGDLGGEPEKTLQDARFVIGDYVSCAIYPPLPNGAVAPAPASGASVRGGAGGSIRAAGVASGGGGGSLRAEPASGDRENGFSEFRVRGSGRNYARDSALRGSGGVPSGEWRRGERLPDAPSGGPYRRGRGQTRY